MESRWEDKEKERSKGKRETEGKAEMKNREEKSAGLKWALNNDEAPW